MTLRIAQPGDAGDIGRMLDDFNREYGDTTPGPERIAERFRELMPSGDPLVLLIGDGPDGVAVMRFRPSVWADALECHLAELYVVPGERGHGLGRALLERAIELARERGANYMDLGTSEDDSVARGLYESLGFVNRERAPDGPLMYFYELEL